MITAAGQLATQIHDVKAACNAFSVPRANFYRVIAGHKEPKSFLPRAKPILALNQAEIDCVLGLLNSERFVDRSPQEVYATLLDEGRYYCSIRTMYRILAQAGEVMERRQRLRTGGYKKPESLAIKPNQVWSWDITKLKGPCKWNYFYLYVILDIFSRYVVGWLLAERESAAYAEQMIATTCEKQNITPHQLTIHADRGASMKSKPVAFLLADLGITKTHSRPYTSNDNPFSEAQFKTLKYSPEFPDRFGCMEDAKSFCRKFFAWYNNEHRHSGINMLTPYTVHHGLAQDALAARKAVLETAFKKHPARFKNKIPFVRELPKAVWINKPNLNSEKKING